MTDKTKDVAPTQGADARPVASELGWTGYPEIDAALIMLDRLDVQSDDDTRVDAISATLRRLATRDATPSVKTAWAVDEEIHLAMYETSKSVKGQPSWQWVTRFVRELRKIAANTPMEKT